MTFTAINPSTGEVVSQHPPHSPEEIEKALARASHAFGLWRVTPVERRAELMSRAADLLEKESLEVAHLLTTEMGKTLVAAKGEVAKAVTTMRFYAANAADFLADEIVPSTASQSGIRFEPLGTILAVMPWNFALFQVIRFVAPTLTAGNVGILKHASNVPGTANYLGSLFVRAGFPEGVFTNLFIGHETLPAIIADNRIAAVTLTGSENAGQAVGKIAGANLKKCVLELGGSDAFIVAASADLQRTVPAAVTGRIQNNGQSCIAAKRFIVVESRAEEFIEQFVAAMSAVKLGDPMDPETTLGPVVSAAQRDLLHAQVEDSLAHGAQLRTGGFVPQGPGFFYPATVLTDVPPESRAGCEELFGPVAVVEIVDTLDEAIDLANATPWGLGGSIWATDPAEISQAVEGIEAGMVFANAIVASMPELPFGGIKKSGFGRELGSFGIREFTNAKTFYIA